MYTIYCDFIHTSIHLFYLFLKLLIFFFPTGSPTSFFLYFCPTEFTWDYLYDHVQGAIYRRSVGKLPVAIPLPLATLNYRWLLWSWWGFTNPTPLLTECWRSQSCAGIHDCCVLIIAKFMSHSELRTSEHPFLSYRSCVLATSLMISLMISGLYSWWSTYPCNLFSILSPVLSDCTNCYSPMKETSLIKA